MRQWNAGVELQQLCAGDIPAGHQAAEGPGPGRGQDPVIAPQIRFFPKNWIQIL